MFRILLFGFAITMVGCAATQARGPSPERPTWLDHENGCIYGSGGVGVGAYGSSKLADPDERRRDAENAAAIALKRCAENMQASVKGAGIIKVASGFDPWIVDSWTDANTDTEYVLALQPTCVSPAQPTTP